MLVGYKMMTVKEKIKFITVPQVGYIMYAIFNALDSISIMISTQKQII